jgi:hypothetical protein
VEARSKSSDLCVNLYILSFNLSEFDESGDTRASVFS